MGLILDELTYQERLDMLHATKLERQMTAGHRIRWKEMPNDGPQSR